MADNAVALTKRDLLASVLRVVTPVLREKFNALTHEIEGLRQQNAMLTQRLAALEQWQRHEAQRAVRTFRGLWTERDVYPIGSVVKYRNDDGDEGMYLARSAVSGGRPGDVAGWKLLAHRDRATGKYLQRVDGVTP